MSKEKIKEYYFINDDGQCVCRMNDMDSVYDTLAGHYKMKHGVVSDDFNEDWLGAITEDEAAQLSDLLDKLR